MLSSIKCYECGENGHMQKYFPQLKKKKIYTKEKPMKRQAYNSEPLSFESDSESEHANGYFMATNNEVCDDFSKSKLYNIANAFVHKYKSEKHLEKNWRLKIIGQNQK